jgi:hypothetical protein
MREEIKLVEESTEELEAIIERAEQVLDQARPYLMASAIATGKLKDRGEWKATHSSFHAYCLDQWGWTRSKMDRQLAWAREISEYPEITDGASREAFATELPPPPSQRAAMQARKDAKEAERLAAQAAVDADRPTDKPASDIPDEPGQQPDPAAPKVDAEPDPELAQARKEADQLRVALDANSANHKAERAALQAERDAAKAESANLLTQMAQEPAQGVSLDFMAQLAIALELSVDSTPEQLLAKVTNLMKAKPAKKATKVPEPKAEPSNVTPIAQAPANRKCAVHPKEQVRLTSVGKFCDECHTLVKHTEKVG